MWNIPQLKYFSLVLVSLKFFCSSKTDSHFEFKVQMGVACLIFKQDSSSLEILHNFWRCFAGVNICPENSKVFPPEKKVFPEKLLIFSGFNNFNQNSEGKSFSNRGEYSSFWEDMASGKNYCASGKNYRQTLEKSANDNSFTCTLLQKIPIILRFFKQLQMTFQTIIHLIIFYIFKGHSKSNLSGTTSV